MVEQVASANGVPLDALYGMLEVLGVDTAGGDIAEQLTVGAGRLKSILAARDAQAPDRSRDRAACLASGPS